MGGGGGDFLSLLPFFSGSHVKLQCDNMRDRALECFPGSSGADCGMIGINAPGMQDSQGHQTHHTDQPSTRQTAQPSSCQNLLMPSELFYKVVVGRILKMSPKISCPLVIQSNMNVGSAVLLVRLLISLL